MTTQILTSNFGAELQSFKVNGEEKIHQGEECVNENGKPYWDRRFEILFPTVGKCINNQTILNGKIYQTQLDGFAKNLEFEPITKLDNYHSYIFKSEKKLFEKYPYEFSFIVTYRVDNNKLTTKYKIVNENEFDMPFGIGSRPALKIDNEELEKGNYYFEFDQPEDKVHFLRLRDGLVGVEFARNIQVIGKRRIPLNSNVFNNDAFIIKGMKTNKISLKNKMTNQTIFTMDFTGFPYLAVFGKKNAPFICLEPWVSMPDSVNGNGVFRQKNDIILLPAKKEFECKYSIEFF